jgi:hypothetical protein
VNCSILYVVTLITLLQKERSESINGSSNKPVNVVGAADIPLPLLSSPADKNDKKQPRSKPKADAKSPAKGDKSHKSDAKDDTGDAMDTDATTTSTTTAAAAATDAVSYLYSLWDVCILRELNRRAWH